MSLPFAISNKAKSACIATLLSLSLFGCGGSSDEPSNTDSEFALNMNLPDSLTGGQRTAALLTSKQVSGLNAYPKPMQNPTVVRSQSSDLPCSFIGSDEEDPFRNGYEMTKFMVSSIAAWGCIADTLIEIANFSPHDGVIHPTDNDTTAANYEADEPTHFSIEDTSDTQVTVRLYYDFPQATPPTSSDDPDFYMSWNTDANGDTSGRLIINALNIDSNNTDEDDPAMMRMDFTYTDSAEVSDMFLKFEESHEWADGFRIRVTKEIGVNPTTQVYVAQGLLKANDQLSELDHVTALPDMKLYTVSNQMGDGAAIAQFEDFGIELELNEDLNLGEYLFDKEDIYFFDDDQTSSEPWDWIEKSIASATYEGGRNIPADGGSWPLSPSLDLLANYLGLNSDYFSENSCNFVGNDCTDLLNAIFADGFADQEANQGSDPEDWRSTALQSAEYLNSIYPNGSDWENAFDHNFAP